MRPYCPLLLLAAGALAPAASAPLTPTYRVTTFAMPQDSFPTVADINNAGQLVGPYTIQGNPAIATGYSSVGAELRPLPPMPGYSAWATSANDAGAVVGIAADASDMRKPDGAFFYSGGQMRDLGTLGGAWARASAVNKAGQVIGVSANASGEARAFLYTDGRMSDLSALVPGGIPINPLDIIGRGDITGSWVVDGEPRAFLYRDGQWTDLGDIGGTNAVGRRVNDSGWVTGDAIRVDNANVPFLYSPERGMREIMLPNDAFQLIGRGINARGDVVGDGYSDHGPWSGGVTVNINSLLEPDAGWSIYPALDINDAGQIAAYGCGEPGCMIVRLDPVPEPATYAMLLGGLATLVAGTAVVGVQQRTRAYLFQNGGVSNLGTLGGNNSGASAINNAGQVVGFSSIASGAEHAFLYQDGVMQDIATLGTSSRARDINERGQVAGHYTDAAGHTRAFIYDNGAMRDLGTLGGDYALATDIGNGGHVLGVSTNADGIEHNFVYADGVMTALATGSQPLRALGINGIGDVVGSLLDGPERGAYLWSGGTLYNIGAMVSPQWRVYDAVAINDRGQIPATGCLQGACSAVLLSPIPEPAVTAMLLAGLAPIGLLRRRRVREDVCQNTLFDAPAG